MYICFIFSSVVQSLLKGESSHGRPQKFFQGLERRHFAFAYHFQVVDVPMQMDVHKTLYCFYTTKKMPNESMSSIRIYFEIFFKWSCTGLRICHKGVLFVTLYWFCWIGAYPYNWVWNGLELSINTFAVLSLVFTGWRESLLKSFVRFVFYTSPIRNACPFHKLPNIHFWEHFLQISHNQRPDQY